MKTFALLILVCLLGAGLSRNGQKEPKNEYEGGSNTGDGEKDKDANGNGDDEKDETMDDDVTNTTTMAILTTVAMETKPKYFTDDWRALYSEEQLKRQPKWTLAEKQPEDGVYQTRMYPEQWWASSHVPCEDETTAMSNRYMALYLYFNKLNYQLYSYDLTYPVLRTVDSRPQPTKPPMMKTTTPKKKPPQKKKPKRKGGKKRRKRKPKKVKVCPIKYTTHFSIPIPLKRYPAKTQDKTIKTSKRPEKMYYVRGYAGNYTAAYCKEQAGLLYLDLLADNIWTHETYWHCATYEAPDGTTEQKYEVWMEPRLE